MHAVLARFVVVCLLILAAAPARAAGPLTYERSLNLGSGVHDLKIDGPYAYVATDRGLTVLDVSVPQFPVVLGSVATGGSSKSQGIDVAYPYAYLASEYDGVHFVNVTDPRQPFIEGKMKLAGAVWDVAVKGNYVYAVTFQGELYVLDVSAKKKPKLVKTLGLLTWSSYKHDAKMIKKLAAHPKSGGSKATSVAIDGNLLVTNDWNYGRLYAYDVTNPASPQFAGTHHVPFVLSVAVDQARGVIYMMSAYGKTSGLYTLPTALLSPTVPTRHASCPECRFLKSGYNLDQGGLALSPSGNRIFHSGGYSGELHVVNVENSAAPFEEAFVRFGRHDLGLAETIGLASKDDTLYVGAGALGLRVYRYPGASD